jgi:hypothetical protein
LVLAERFNKIKTKLAKSKQLGAYLIEFENDLNKKRLELLKKNNKNVQAEAEKEQIKKSQENTKKNNPRQTSTLPAETLNNSSSNLNDNNVQNNVESIKNTESSSQTNDNLPNKLNTLFNQNRYDELVQAFEKNFLNRLNSNDKTDSKPNLPLSSLNLVTASLLLLVSIYR